MIADIHFLAVPGVCMANGHYLLRGSDFDMTDYIVETVEDIKCTKDLDQIRTVPEFDGYERVNLAVIEGADGSLTWYWVVSVNESTLKRSSLDFNLSYCAPTDLYEEGDALDGLFTRYPENVRRYLKDVITSDALKNERYDRLGTMYDEIPIDIRSAFGASIHTQVFWVEVVSEKNLLSTGGASNSDLIRYGFPVWFDLDKPIFRRKVISTDVTIGTEPVWFPELMDFLANPERFMIPADSIHSISISPICPYTWELLRFPLDPNRFFIKVHCKDQTGADAIPIVYQTQGEGVPDYPGATTVSYYGLYMLDAHDVGGTVSYPVSAPWQSAQVFYTDAQSMIGTVSLATEKGEQAVNVPTEILISGNDATRMLDLSYKVVSDYTGLFLHVRFNDDPMHVAIMPCGQLPWIGDAWEQYRVRQQATDREAMENAISNAKDEMWQSLAMAGVNAVTMPLAGAMTKGGLGQFGVGMGAQMVGTGLTQAMQGAFNLSNVTRNERQNLALTEHSMKAAAGTGYATSYGLGFVIACCTIGFGVLLQMPANITSSYIESYTDEHGYPCEGLVNGTAMEGFYQGRVLPSVTGIKAERLVDIFEAGLRFITL